MMIAEAVPDASARVFLAERKATTPPAASAAAGTTVAAAAATSKPPPPPLPVSASFARSNPWTDLSSPLDAKQRLLLLFLGVPLLLWRLLLTATILPCVHVCFWALVAGQDLGAPLSPARARCTSALLR
jgi:pilus assembly protein TadC